MKTETITIGNFLDIASEFGWGCAIRFVWHNAKHHETFLDHLNHDVLHLDGPSKPASSRTCTKVEDKTPTTDIKSNIKFCNRKTDNKPYITGGEFINFWNSHPVVILFGHSDERTLETTSLKSIVRHEKKLILKHS